MSAASLSKTNLSAHARYKTRLAVVAMEYINGGAKYSKRRIPKLMISVSAAKRKGWIKEGNLVIAREKVFLNGIFSFVLKTLKMGVV